MAALPLTPLDTAARPDAPHETRRAGDTVAHVDEGHDLRWRVGDGPSRSLVDTLRAAGVLRAEVPGRGHGASPTAWALSPSGRTLYVLAGTWPLRVEANTSIASAHLYVIDAARGGFTVIEPEPAGWHLVGVTALDDDTCALTARHHTRLLRRLGGAWTDAARLDHGDTERAAGGRCGDRTVLLLAGASRVEVAEVSPLGFTELGEVIATAWRVHVDGEATVTLAPCSATETFWSPPPDAQRVWRVELPERPSRPATPTKSAKASKPPKPGLALVEHPEIALAKGRFVRDIPALHEPSPMAFPDDDTVTVRGRRFARPGAHGSFALRGDRLWCVTGATVHTLDLDDPQPAWRAVLPQCAAPEYAVPLSHSLAVIALRARPGERQGALMLCARDARGVWQTLHRHAVPVSAVAWAHPTEPVVLLRAGAEVQRWSAVDGALKKVASVAIGEKGDRREARVLVAHGRVWVGRCFAHPRPVYATADMDFEWLREVVLT